MVFLAGLPFAPFLFRSLDLWHGHGVWAQGGTLLLFAASLGGAPPIVPLRPNRPLAGLVGWVSLLSLWVWVTQMIQQKVYPVPMLQSLMHFVLLVLFYLAATTTWTAAFVQRLLRGMAWSGAVILAYCLLQIAQLDQFFRGLGGNPYRDELVGVIGNPSHLSIHLALLLPCFLLQRGRFWTCCTIVCLGLIIRTQSLGGWLAALGVLTWWAWHSRKAWLWGVGLACAVGLVWLEAHPTWLNPSGRWNAWKAFWQFFLLQPITGQGLGYTMELSRRITDSLHPLYQWRHVHNEYFQVAMELGVVGLGCVGWMVKDLIHTVSRLRKSPLMVALSAMLIAFGLNSLVNFPAHLWATGSLALMAYCGIQVVARDVVEGGT